MHTLGAITMWVGLIVMLVGGVTFLIAAFEESLLWGLGVLLLPLVSLAFLVLNWQRAKGPFFTQLYGIAIVLLGVLAFKAHLPFVHGHW